MVRAGSVQGANAWQFERSWFRRTGPSPAQPPWSCSSLLPLPSWGLAPVTTAPAQLRARPWLCPAPGSCSLCPCCRPAGCRAVAGAAGLPRWETGPSWHEGCWGPSPADAAAPRDGVSPTPCCSPSALQPGAPPAPCRLPAAWPPPGSCRGPEVHREGSRG